MALVVAGALAAGAAAGGIATAGEGRAEAGAAVRAPVVTKVAPRTLGARAAMRVTGRGFVRGRRANTVVFLGGRGRGDDVKVRATGKSSRAISLRAPKARTTKGGAGAVSGRIQVVNRRGRSRPSRFRVVFDDDRDGLSNERELALGTDPRRRDSDGDGIPDGRDPDPLRRPGGAAALTNTSPPTIGGTARDGATLTAQQGTWSGAAPIAYTYQWQSCASADSASCQDIAGATAVALPLGSGLVGRRIRVAITADDAAPGSAVAFSALTAPVAAVPSIRSSFESLRNVVNEARPVIAHDAYPLDDFVEYRLLRKPLGGADSQYAIVNSSANQGGSTLDDSERVTGARDYVYRTDVMTDYGPVTGSDTVVVRAGAKIPNVAGQWAQLNQSCGFCGTARVWNDGIAGNGSLRLSSVGDGGTGGFGSVGSVAVYGSRLDLAAGEDRIVRTRVNKPLGPSVPGAKVAARMTISQEHPSTARDLGTGAVADLSRSSKPRVTVEVRALPGADPLTVTDDVIEVAVEEGTSPTDGQEVAVDTLPNTIPNVWPRIVFHPDGTYSVRYTTDPDSDAGTLTDLVSHRPRPGSMTGGWLTLAQGLSREATTGPREVRFSLVGSPGQISEGFEGTAAEIQVPPGFTTTRVAGDPNGGPSGLTGPTAIAFAPDGRMFIAEKDGVIKVLDNGTTSTVVDIGDRVNSSGANEHGLTGLALDPAFATNHRAYIQYTVQPTTGGDTTVRARARVSRIDLDGTQQQIRDSEVALVGDPDGDPDTDRDPESPTNACPPGPASDCIPADAFTHASGQVLIGADGKLWISTADGASPEGPDGHDRDLLAFRSLNDDSLAGKLLRVDPVTGDGVIGNPDFDMADPDSPASRTYAKGFRNPYRFTQRPGGSNAFYVGDVGWGAWEELDVVPLALPANGRPRNYGWPCYEGAPSGHPAETSYQGFTPPGPNCSDTDADPNRTGPVHSYDSFGTDHAILGAAFYTGSAYPEPFRATGSDASFYYADYPTGDVHVLRMNAADQATGSPEAFASGFGFPAMVAEGPASFAAPAGDRAIYVVDIGSFFLGAADGAVWRITYGS